MNYTNQNSFAQENDNELATLFNLGGGVELINSTLVRNNANDVSFQNDLLMLSIFSISYLHYLFLLLSQLAIFSNIGNAHAFIHEDTSFHENSARLGPVFIDNYSYLQLSRDNEGSDNIGGQCDGIFMEDVNSLCLDRDLRCTGNCCAFGDETCDLFFDD